VSDLSSLNFDQMSTADFERYLPELFASSPGGKVSDNPRLRRFLDANPDCAALVRDLETIAETARSLFEPEQEPSDAVWSNIASKLKDSPASEDDGAN
jgi:hypothetical protein